MLAERVRQARAAGAELTCADVAALLRQAVTQVRRLPAPSRPAPSGAPANVAEGRRLVEELYAAAAEIGRICLEIAPAYWSEAEAPEALALFADDICLDLPGVLARRRYALTGDRRCLAGVL
ncbi:hypothetical protein SAMN05216275_11352 [Streptosporangium canum]|uniref:Uncharacterized protein n=1 Tax=Streptosporangium canum TaxID=324952 RepID=A0A1I3UTD4_9ACTN|nr:hypothetical protein [Streptosporangium canum]SFJ85336.1 hypothetical protein SAMN05216275_11352 [Streptosporangium canum]